MSVTGPRIFGITATAAPIVAVIRRGPTDWCQVGRWVLDDPRFEPGAWFRGTIYPQRCDLSPDGRWLAYSALKHSADWPAGSIYEAISRLPWLTALAAWEAGSTYTRGIHFDDDVGVCDLGVPDVGDVAPALAVRGIKLTAPAQFAVERRRGWVETEGTPSREEGGPWDEQRQVQMERPNPAGGPRLHVEGSFAAFRGLPEWREPATYALMAGDDVAILKGVQWADWDGAGRLLTATADGRLQIRELDPVDVLANGSVVFEEDLARFAPDPQPSPEWAFEW